MSTGDHLLVHGGCDSGASDAAARERIEVVVALNRAQDQLRDFNQVVQVAAHIQHLI